jgi:hypothetical protein
VFNKLQLSYKIQLTLLMMPKAPRVCSSDANIGDGLTSVSGPMSVSVEQRSAAGSQPGRIFLLSPANVAGIRAGFVTNANANSEMARRLRQGGVQLGDLFSFMSSLYFRGKLAYARAFANAPLDMEGAFVITASGGLISPNTLITLERLREISAGNIDLADSRYIAPLDRDARRLFQAAGTNCQIVLLGSIATPKYVDPLFAIFGERLAFPSEFVGRGDMSRGGLMLRCVQSGEQLTYIPVLEAKRNGCRPPRLQPMPRGSHV